ncbi:unnamed protein product [Schistosoma curassoni]|uniref:Integrase_H2C2 domain-containing protein n=1 Tax=Schistosoma curassoni TaxID=6186 RepID=A0A183JR99_9TREM|nr:unnamed protein product [Schistosoma curassoni]
MQFHSDHPGTNIMKSLARSYAYRLSMEEDIKNKCLKCPSCLQSAKDPLECEPQHWSTPARPWEKCFQLLLMHLLSSPAMSISGTCPVVGSNPIAPETQCTNTDLSSSQKDDVLINAHENIALLTHEDTANE